MFGRFIHKKTTEKENPPLINLTVEWFLNNASRIQQPRLTSGIRVDPKGQTPGNSIIAVPSAPADPAQVSSSSSTSSTSAIETIVILVAIIVAVFVDVVSGNIQTFWKASPGDSRTSVIGIDPANPQGQTPGNSIIAGPSAPSTSSTSAQALPQAGGRSRISSSVSIGQDQAFDEAGAAPIK